MSYFRHKLDIFISYSKDFQQKHDLPLLLFKMRFKTLNTKDINVDQRKEIDINIPSLRHTFSFKNLKK